MIGLASGPSHKERFLRGYAGRLSFPLALGWFGAKLARDLLPPLLPAVADDLALSPSEAGVALTVLGICYALLQYPGGRLSDGLSRKTVLVGGLAVALAGSVALALAGSKGELLLGVALLGVGTGLYSIPWRALLSELYVDRRGAAFGVVQAAGRLGSSLTAVVAVGALAVGSWNLAYLPVAVVMAVVAVLYHRWSREPYVIDRVPLGVGDTAGRVFASPGIRRLVVAYIAYAFVWQGVSRFLPTFLHETKGFTLLAASSGFAALFLVGLVVAPVAGDASDRLARGPIAAAVLGLGALGIALVIVGSSLPAIATGIVLFAVGMLAFPPVMQAYLMDRFPEESMGGDLGALKTVYTGIGSLSPTYVGLVAERLSYAAAFSGLAVLLVVATGLLLWRWRTGVD